MSAVTPRKQEQARRATEKHLVEAFIHFKRDCEELVKKVAIRHPDGFQVDGDWTVIGETCHNGRKVTFQGKRSSHGGRATRGGIRDPISPIKIQFRGSNDPYIATLMAYIKNMTHTQLEASPTLEHMETKLIQVDTKLTAKFTLQRF